MRNFVILVIFLTYCTTSCFGNNEVCVERKKSYGKYLGCFEDHEFKRMFRGYLIHSHDKNSIGACINTCLSHRFVYAGMQDR